MTHLEKTSSFFDREAPYWRDLYDEDDVYAVIQRERRSWALQKVDELGLSPGTVVLDAGVGGGGLATALAADGLRVIGIDTSPGMLALTRQAARERRVAGRVVVLPADATDLPFPDESFPLVIALGLVPWVDDAGRLVRELARVTASGGHLILTADNRSRLTHALDPLFNPRLARLRRAVGRLLGRDRSTRVRTTYHTVSGFRQLLSQAGLEILEARSLGFGPFTFAGLAVLPRRVACRAHQVLQRSADRGLPVLRSTGCQHLVLATRPG